MSENKKPRQKRKTKEYTNEELKSEIEKVSRGETSSYESSKRTGIPRSTIENHLRGKVTSFRNGRPPFFSNEQELMVFDFIIALGKCGYPPNKEEFQEIAKQFSLQFEVKYQDKQWIPGEDWLASFRRRWRDRLGFRIANNMGKNRANSITQESLSSFYDLVETTFNELGLNDKPKHIFNCDETNFASVCTKNKVFCEKGVSNINKIALNNEKQNYSVNVCCDADGFFLPMYVIYKGTRMYSTWTEDGPKECCYNVSENGWMDSKTFKDWFEHVFIKHTKHIIGPKVLFLDGHKSHITIEVIRLAKESSISILCLPPHATHILQPLDVSVFKPAKTVWRKIVNEKVKAQISNINKEIFPSLLKELVTSKDAFKRQHVISGFEATGIHPFNRDAIPQDKWKYLINSNNSMATNDDAENDEEEEFEEVDLEESVQEQSIEEDAETEENDRIIITESVTAKSAPKSVLRDVTNVANSQIIQNVFLALNKPAATKTAKKRKVVGSSGSCITSDEALNFLEEEQAAKKAKLAEAAEKKKLKEEKKKAAEEEIEKKKETKLKKQKLMEREQELKAIKKINKSKKQCFLCFSNLDNDLKNKTKWLNCFRCSKWCCFKCLPTSFKGAAATSAYKCEECLSLLIIEQN